MLFNTLLLLIGLFGYIKCFNKYNKYVNKYNKLFMKYDEYYDGKNFRYIF